jgi:hypothetical protein
MDGTEPQEPRANKQIIFLMCIYIVLSVSNRFSTPLESDSSLIDKITKNETIPFETVLGEFDKQRLEGDWKQTSKSATPRLSNQQGKFELFMTRHSENSEERFTLDINLKNGEYIDDGEFILHIPEIKVGIWKVEEDRSGLTARATLNSSVVRVVYNEELIFRTLSRGDFNLSKL